MGNFSESGGREALDIDAADVQVIFFVESITQLKREMTLGRRLFNANIATLWEVDIYLGRKYYNLARLGIAGPVAAVHFKH